MHDVNPELLSELRRNAQSSEPPARGSPRRPCDRAEAGRGAGTRRRSHPRIRQGDRIPTAGTTRPMRSTYRPAQIPEAGSFWTISRGII